MIFRYYLPTRLFFGWDALKREGGYLKSLGSRLLVVMGPRSARECGLWDDLQNLGRRYGIEWIIYDRVRANPDLAAVKEGLEVAKEEKVEGVLGAGGGSPLDVAKAIALLANNSVPPENLYEGDFPNPPLPLGAIPTTAGTGSEVTPYAVFSLHHLKTKRGFAHEGCFPRVAWVDPRYTLTLSRELTIDTALDALSHAVEGYLSCRASPYSDILAREALRLWGKRREQLLEGDYTPEFRQDLLWASTLAGMVIAHTRTTVLHTLGHYLTYHKGTPHGRANGYFLAAYLEFVRPAVEARVGEILAALRLRDLLELRDFIRELLPPPPMVEQGEREKWARMALTHTHALELTARLPQYRDLLNILESSLS